jgi:hypothetical protein
MIKISKILPLSLNKLIPRIVISQIFWSLTKLVEKSICHKIYFIMCSFGLVNFIFLFLKVWSNIKIF